MIEASLSFRQVQVVWRIAIAFGGVSIVFGGFARKPFHGSLDWRHGALLGLAVWSLIGGFSTRRKLLSSATSKAKGRDPSAARTWTAAQLISIMLYRKHYLMGACR